MKHGTTIALPPDFLCLNCRTKDFDTKTIEQICKNDTYVCIRIECRHCKHIYTSLPFRVIESLEEEIKENV